MHGLSGSDEGLGIASRQRETPLVGGDVGMVDEQDACDGLLLEPVARVALGDSGSRASSPRRRAPVPGQRRVETEPVADHHREEVEGLRSSLEEALPTSASVERSRFTRRPSVASLISSPPAWLAQSEPLWTRVTRRAGTGPRRPGCSAPKERLDAPPVLVVEEALPPVARHVLGNSTTTTARRPRRPPRGSGPAAAPASDTATRR